VAVGVTWAACGWLPLLLPGLGWHAYYGLFGALGAWLALAALVPPGAPAAALVALLALLSVARDATPSLDWGDAAYQRRAGVLLRTLRAGLLERVPHPAPHTRFWFVALPSNIGFLQGDGPALRTWYADTTLRAGFFSAWRPAAAGSPGEDRFFKLHDATRWVELVPGPEDARAAVSANPRWAEDHLSLGRTFADAGEWERAAAEFAKVAEAYPQDAEPAYNLAVCRAHLGDSLAAGHWMEEARRRPVVTERLRRAARASGLGWW
jgi:tetratricopeptide (TPR) repeat protein